MGVGSAIVRRLVDKGIQNGFFAQRQGSTSAGAGRRLHGCPHLSGGGALRRGDGAEPAQRQSLATPGSHGGTEAQSPGAEFVESFSAAFRARRRPLQSGVRAAVRDHGAFASRAGGVQLLGARYRQHGSTGPLCDAGATEALAGAAAGGPHSLGLCDDRARRRIERCHEHPILDRARRCSLRDQRPQMVDFRRRRSALRDLDIHGQDRPRSAAAQPAIHDSRAHEHARRAAAASAACVRLRSRAAWPCADRFRRCARARGESSAG